MNAKRLILGFFTLFTLCVLSSCEEAVSLEHVQDRKIVDLKGSFLTESPDDIVFPVKVLFAIDMSLSMGQEIDGQVKGSDPNMLRIEAVKQFINEYNVNETASFEVSLWSANRHACTYGVNGCGFTKDPNELMRVLDSAANVATTNYIGAIDELTNDIVRDIQSTANQDNISRTKYVVVFLSDGVANASGQPQSDGAIWQRVQTLKTRMDQANVGGFNFHTFLLDGGFVGGNAAAEKASATRTLQGMANIGDGQFREFESADSIDFINLVDMRLTAEYKLKTVFAYNFNTVPGTDLIQADSDADGLSNEEEAIYGTDPLDADTDDDGLSDFLEVRLSSPGAERDPLTSDSNCDPFTLLPDGTWPDTDKDGLNDCEEMLKGTDRRTIDSDGDGVPDLIEFMVGTNPIEDEGMKDSDFDGRWDFQEIQSHTNVLRYDPLLAERYAYSYDIQDAGLVELDQGLDEKSYVRKYNYHISNLDVVDTLIPGRSHENSDTALRPGDNLIRLYISQTPEDKPDKAPVYRVATFYVNVDDGSARDVSNITFELLQ